MTNHENKSATIMEKYGLIRDKDGEVHRAQNTQSGQSQTVANIVSNARQSGR